jgi:uncharacterized protein YjbI with pentapeptide repeats
MANPEHLAILKQGVEVWNWWRAAEAERVLVASRGRGEHEVLIPDLSDADLEGANLMGVNLTNVNLRRVNFQKADLQGALLVISSLDHADLRSADCRGVLFGEGHHAGNTGGHWEWFQAAAPELTNVKFGGANLEYAKITSVRLDGSDFTGIRLRRTEFVDLDLRSVKCLERAEHGGLSFIDVSTIYRSNGQIPEAFMRSCGIPEGLIAYAQSLVGLPIQFYSCFISYSSKDQVFANRLHADLQDKGVRCWFAPEDLKIGAPFRQRIDESIRLHDKLLLILSEHSVQSAWVQDEVEAALERERREKRLVLFPIRIDDAVMDTDQAWAAAIRRTRHIGDFTRWKDPDSYQTAFERLLRDLKGEPGSPPAP